MPLDTIGVYDLCYNAAMAEKIKARFPSAIIEDACDEVHDSRIVVNIPDVTKREFYTHALDCGYAISMLGFNLAAGDSNNPEFFRFVQDWVSRKHQDRDAKKE